jgi:hypothetical protein
MAIDWNGLFVSVVDSAGDSYEKRIHRQIFFAGLVGLALILIWKGMR